MAVVSQGVTPGRDLRLEIDPPDRYLYRSQFSFERQASQMGRHKTAGAGSSRNVFLYAGDAWMLSANLFESSHLISVGNTSFVQKNDLNTIPEITTRRMHASPSLLGVSVSDQQSTGAPYLVKSVIAGSSWNSRLNADQTAFPGPTLETQQIDMDRVVSGKVTYLANEGFTFMFYNPNMFVTPDNLLTFYFGGPTSDKGGEFALNVRGGGTAILYERVDGSWVRRMSFEWAQSEAAKAGLTAIQIQPYDRDRIWFRVMTTGSPILRSGFTGLPMPLPFEKVKLQERLYRHSESAAGFSKKQFCTGAGTCRLDVRRDLRLIFAICIHEFPSTGALVDGAFVVDHYLPEFTPIKVRTHKVLPPGATMEVSLYNAVDDTLLGTNADGDFLSPAGHCRLYVVFDFLSATKDYSPILYSYRVEILPATATRSPDTKYLHPVQASITGPDLEPTQDSASCTVNDLTDSVFRLRRRDRIPVRLTTLTEDGVTRSILFDGESVRARATRKIGPRRRGFAGTGGLQAYPSPQSREYQLQMVGRWARLADQILLGYENYSRDFDAPENEDGTQPPWKITDIIKDLLSKAGVPDEQMDVPDNPLRFWQSQQGLGEYLLQPGASMADMILRLCGQYLGQPLVWDPNAGASGMWRLLDNPLYWDPTLNVVDGTATGGFHSGTAVPLWTFKTEHPGTVAIPTAMNAYGANSCFAQSYETYPIAPEGNIVVVAGAGGVLSDDQGASSMVAILRNSASFSANPSNPTALENSQDYLNDREVPILYSDPMLVTPEAVRFVCRRIYDFACHGQKWVEFTAPLVLLTDPTDTNQTRPRPLRINDVVFFNTSKLILRSVNPVINSSRMQMAHYEAMELGQ